MYTVGFDSAIKCESTVSGHDFRGCLFLRPLYGFMLQIYILYIYQINQITMRVLSPMWEVSLVKSILQAELLIYIAKCLMSFNVTKRTVNQSYSSILYILVEAARLRRASTASAHC